MGGGCRSVISEAIAAVLCRLAVISGSELLDALKLACMRSSRSQRRRGPFVLSHSC